MSEPEAQPTEAVPDDMQALEEAVKLADGFGALAKLIGCAGSAPSMWRSRGAVPEDQAPNIEFAVGGRVTAERLCPTGKFVRVPDPAWPHPEGRPLIDAAREGLKQAA